MALPIDVCLPDYSNLKDINKKIIFCCTKMQEHIIGKLVTYTIDNKETTQTVKPEGLAFIPITETNKIPQILLSAEGQVFEPISFCPFCSSKIEIRPS